MTPEEIKTMRTDYTSRFELAFKTKYMFEEVAESTVERLYMDLREMEQDFHAFTGEALGIEVLTIPAFVSHGADFVIHFRDSVQNTYRNLLCAFS
jgi:hypothetical protein